MERKLCRLVNSVKSLVRIKPQFFCQASLFFAVSVSSDFGICLWNLSQFAPLFQGMGHFKTFFVSRHARQRGLTLKSSYFVLRAVFPSHSFIPLQGQSFIYPKPSYGRRKLHLRSYSPKQVHLDCQERRGGFTGQCLFSLLHLFLHAIYHFCLVISGASSFLSIHKDISRCDV